MAARKRRGTKENPWPEEVKNRIRSSMLVNRLQNHAAGKCDMTNSQVRAAEILLSKTIPNLSASENKSEVIHRYVARAPAVTATDDAWQEQHTPAPTIQ